MKEKDKITMVKVTVGTREKLKKMRVSKRETYEEIITRLLKK